MLGEVEVALVAEGLVGEDQHRILREGGLDRRDVVGAERPAEIDVADLGGERGRDGMDGDGQESPDPVFARDWTTEGARRQMAFMTRMLGFFLAVLLLGIGPSQAAPLENKDGFWSEWNDATFERARPRRSS